MHHVFFLAPTHSGKHKAYIGICIGNEDVGSGNSSGKIRGGFTWKKSLEQGPLAGWGKVPAVQAKAQKLAAAH